MTDDEIGEVIRQISASQMRASMNLVEALVFTLHNSEKMDKSDFVGTLRAVIDYHGDNLDQITAAAFQGVIADLTNQGQTPVKGRPNWRVITGGKKE
jgi:hypothetical protein